MSDEIVERNLLLDARPTDLLFLEAFRAGLTSMPKTQRSGALASTIGHVAESVAAELLQDLGYQVVWQLEGPGTHGVDVLMLDPTLEHAVAIEVKGTFQQRRWPRLTRRELVQMSAPWLDKSDNPGMTEWGFDSNDVFGCVIFINFAQRAWRAGVTADFAALRWLESLDELADPTRW